MIGTITLNVELLDRTLKFAEAHAELCGVPSSIARTAVSLNDRHAFDGTTWETRRSGGIETPGGLRPIAEYAVELLGLTEQQAGLLFAPGNSLDDLRNVVATIKGDDE